MAKKIYVSDKEKAERIIIPTGRRSPACSRPS
jgi:hypothetical protein